MNPFVGPSLRKTRVMTVLRTVCSYSVISPSRGHEVGARICHAPLHHTPGLPRSPGQHGHRASAIGAVRVLACEWGRLTAFDPTPNFWICWSPSPGWGALQRSGEGLRHGPSPADGMTHAGSLTHG